MKHDQIEDQLQNQLKITWSKLGALVAEVDQFFALNPEGTFSDPTYFEKHEELTAEADRILDEIHEHQKRKYPKP